MFVCESGRLEGEVVPLVSLEISMPSEEGPEPQSKKGSFDMKSVILRLDSVPNH